MSRYETPNLNKWVGNENAGLWEYSYYRGAYLTIRKLDNGKYKPMVGANGNLDMPSVPLPKSGQHELDTFEAAEQFLFKYIDYIREEWDKKSRDALHARLHRLNPNVFPV